MLQSIRDDLIADHRQRRRPIQIERELVGINVDGHLCTGRCDDVGDQIADKLIEADLLHVLAKVECRV